MFGSVTLLGSGTCRISHEAAPVSSCVILGSTTFLIDVGAGALERLDRAGAFDACESLHVHISHAHIDHSIGIFPLLQCLTWSDDARHLNVKSVTIHATEEVCSLIARVQELLGAESTSLKNGTRACDARILTFAPGPNYSDWNYNVDGLSVSSVHLPGANNHGVTFSLNQKRYALTADATEVSDGLIEFSKDADVCVFDFGHITNVQTAQGAYEIDLQPAIELLTKANPKLAVAAHIYLRHLQHRPLSDGERADERSRLVRQSEELATKAGFSGRLVEGADRMRL